MHIKHLQGENIHYILYTKVDKAFKLLITLLYYTEYCNIAYFVNSECSMADFLSINQSINFILGGLKILHS